jgi:hypothetical protein
MKNATVFASLALLYACDDTTINNLTIEDPAGPPSPTLVEFFEAEPNDYVEEANFISNIPTRSELSYRVNATLTPNEYDVFEFYQTAKSFDERHFFSLYLRCPAGQPIRVRLSQMIVDEEGNEVGDQTLGFWVGNGGVSVTDFPIPYHFLEANTIFVEVYQTVSGPCDTCEPFDYSFEFLGR